MALVSLHYGQGWLKGASTPSPNRQISLAYKLVLEESTSGNDMVWSDFLSSVILFRCRFLRLQIPGNMHTMVAWEVCNGDNYGWVPACIVEAGCYPQFPSSSCSKVRDLLSAALFVNSIF